ncbi:MAG TPA: DNA-directed RNA polymerase subunit H [Candidatus Woesearchaeota archaeon]|nr:MAG: DNA-directed RNA polymerase subunit H [Candidatus Woesearchaeota archaeon]HDD70911.1 DNA-directed RNA polymerase subunit H [Candidatus Woesearchaeota archaeon]
MAKKFDVRKHVLVPKHSLISEKEKKSLFEKQGFALENLPCILKSDPAIAELDVKEGDVIKIVRQSPTAGTTTFYRRVIND